MEERGSLPQHPAEPLLHTDQSLQRPPIPTTASLNHRRRHDTITALNLDTVINLPNVRSANSPAHPHAPSAAIAIPSRTVPNDRPVTPLSGRPRKQSVFENESIDTSHVRRYSSSSAASQASSEMSSTSPTRSRPVFIDIRRRQAEAASYPHIASPLSPGSAHQTPVQERPAATRPYKQNLKLSGLPKFHPANFHHNDASPMRSPPTGRPGSAGSRGSRLGSDAQQRLHKYQRESVANCTKRMLSPQPPRLEAQGSPGACITPLALETSGDYLTAGSTISPTKRGTSAREFVDRLIQKENMARSHPEARSGSASPAYSPTFSPAVSPA